MDLVVVGLEFSVYDADDLYVSVNVEEQTSDNCIINQEQGTVWDYIYSD